jgi:hypothetical protein
MEKLKDLLWTALKSRVDALITDRILLFHDALVDRGQILPLPPPVDPKETPMAESSRCKHGHNI